MWLPLESCSAPIKFDPRGMVYLPFEGKGPYENSQDLLIGPFSKTGNPPPMAYLTCRARSRSSWPFSTFLAYDL
jgi:hypothetical protein